VEPDVTETGVQLSCKHNLKYSCHRLLCSRTRMAENNNFFL